MTETWKDIKGWEGIYQVSDLGRIKSLPRKGSGNSLVGRFLTPCDNGKGYQIVSFYTDRKRKNHYVHILVADAFIPNPNLLPQVNHRDGNKGNNRLQNLERCSLSENMRHAYENGLLSVGEKSHMSKLKQSEVVQMRFLDKEGVSRKELSARFGISKAQVCRIINRKLWRHVL